MKQATKTTRMIAMGLFTLCTMGLAKATFAGSKSDDPIEFKYIGKIKNRPVFQLNLNNNEAEVYLISIKDENYDLLYSEKVKAKDPNLSRNYALDIDEGDLNAPGFAVTVEVTSTITHLKQVYKISSHRSVTEKIIVAKL
jgi:hypothetical protein